MANGEKGALIIQGLESGGIGGAITAAVVTSTDGDQLPGVNVPAATQATAQEPVALDGVTYAGYTGVNPVTGTTVASGLNSLTTSDWIFIALGVLGILIEIYYGEQQ